MQATRREALGLAAGGLALALVGGQARAAATAEFEAALAKVLDGAEPAEGRITLTAPSIAENGNSVPVSLSVASPMTEGDHVATVTLLADGNPHPEVAVFHFTPLAGRAEVTTRMRLARTQNVVAVARMSDGTVHIARAEVKVTIGGCGG